MTNYEKIRAATNKACPELLELTFGCEVGIGEWRDATSYIVLNGKPHNLTIMTDEGRIVDGFMLGGNWTIFGKPPELQNVLRALDKASEDIVMNLEGNFMEYIYHEGLEYLGHTYDLTKPLHEQSEQTLEFLASLLPNPEKDE